VAGHGRLCERFFGSCGRQRQQQCELDRQQHQLDGRRSSFGKRERGHVRRLRNYQRQQWRRGAASVTGNVMSTRATTTGGLPDEVACEAPPALAVPPCFPRPGFDPPACRGKTGGQGSYNLGSNGSLCAGLDEERSCEGLKIGG
jgi:hypothetical protein